MTYNPEELQMMADAIKKSKASPKDEGGATKTTPKTDMEELVRGAKIGAQKLREEEQKRLEEEAKAKKAQDDFKRTMAEGHSNIMQTIGRLEEGADRIAYNMGAQAIPTVQDRMEKATALSMGMSPEEYEQAKFNEFRSARRYAESAAKQEPLAKDMLSSDVIIQNGSPDMYIDQVGRMYYKDVADAAYEINKGLGLPYIGEDGGTHQQGKSYIALRTEYGKTAPEGSAGEFNLGLQGYATEQIAERAAQEAQELAEKYTQGEPYVNLNGTMYSQYDLANYFFGQIMEVSHSQRIATDTDYQDYLFFQEYGITRKDAMRQRVAEIRNELKALQHQAGDDAYWDKKHEVENYLATNAGGLETILRFPSWEADMAEGLAEKPYDDLLEQLDAWEQNDFSSGFAAAFDWANVFSLGMADVIVGGNINNALENARKGYYMSDSEKALVKMVQLTQELQSYRDKLYAPQSTWSMIGEGLGGTAEVLPEFALGMIATGGIGAGVKYGAGQAAKRFIANKTIANAASVVGHGALDLTKWAVGNYARGMAAAPMTAMFYEGVLEGYNSQYHFEGDNLVYTPKNKATIWAGAYIDTVNEFASEGMGATIGDVVGLGLKGTGRMMGITKKANKSVTGATTRKFLQAPMKESTKKLLKDFGYGGSLTSEWTGEMLGDFMSQWQRYMVGAEYDFEHFKDFDSWLTTIGVSAIMGGTMTTLGGGMNIYQETKMAKDIAQNRERIINKKIQDAALRDKLRMLSEVDDPMLAASELADYFNTHNIENASDKAYALDYITLNSQLKVLMGDVQEQERMVKFETKRAEIEGKAYHGADGKSTRNVITVRDTEGNAYYVLKGDMANKEAMLELMDVNTGEMTTKVASAVTKPETASVDSLLINAYGNMFSLEEEVSRVKDVTGALSSVEKPTMEHVETTAMQLDITLPKKGDVVTMVDGKTAEITEDLGDGTYIAQRKASVTGLSETITLPFDAIRSNDSLTAKAQEAILNSGVESAVDATSTAQATAEVQTPVESATPQPTTQTTSGVSVGAVIVAPNGEQARVVEINDDGTVTLNYNLNEGASMADAAIEVVRMDDLTKEDGSDASANVPTTAQTEIPQPAVPQPVAETPTTEAVDAAQNVEVVPTQQDGSVDFDAIEDPAQCAQMMAAMLGGPENALAIVEESIEAVKAEMDKAVKAKAPTINEGVAKQNKINEIKARLIRYEQIAFELEQMMKPAEAKAESVEHEAGLVENEHTAGLPEGMRKSIDEMAKRAKVRIEFVDERIKGDAEQKGNLIRVSTRNRTKAVEVLVGHEMLHYMKSKMPEAYKAFKEAVIAFIGEDKFAKEVARRKKAYAAQNVKLNDEDAAEEIVADYAGFLVQGRDVFEKFIEPKKSDNVFLRGLKKGLEYIRNIFGANGMTKQVNAVDNMVDTLNTLINATVEGKDIEKREEASAETTKTEETTAEEAKGEDGETKTKHSLKAQPSLVGVHNISLDKLRKVIKMGGLANPSVAVIDVDKQTHDDYGEYSLVLPKNMVDARKGKNAGTWAGDAWTPTYPQIVKRMNDDKAISRFYKDIDALPEVMRNRVRLDFDSFMDALDAGALAYWYLHEKGDNPILVETPSRYSEEVTNALSEATKGTFNMYNLTPEERAKCLDVYIDAKYNGDKAAYEAEVQSKKERLIGKAETVASDRVKKWAQDKVDELNEYGFDYSEVSDFVRDVETDMRNKGTVNVAATIRAAKEQIENGNLIADYDIWLESLDERYGIKEYIFDGFTKNGDRKYMPHTVQNASKWMKKQGREGATAIFPSFGVFIANAIPKMTTLESIRKRKEMLGKSKEEFEAFKDKWTEVYHDLGKKLQPEAKGFDDYGYWRLIEAVGQNNPQEYIKKQYGIELSEGDIAKFNEMVNAIRTEYPARYFETKFERPLQLSDFTAAVVPNDIPLDVESRLKDANVEVIEYEKSDNASRAEAVQKASALENVRFSLSAAPTFYSNAQYAVQNIKQEKATPEQWLKMIEKAGGLKAGEDKWLGLSDWLKASDKKTLTKDEVLQYIAENDIQIEEVSYGDVADISREEIYESAEFAELREGLTEYDEDDNPYINRERYDELRSESYDFVDGFSLDYWGEELEVDSPAAAATYLGLTNADKEINETRLGYTTHGLNNKREIALVVPTIEPYIQSDNIHFGDAGEGRAVAWMRFGETTDAEGKRVLVIDEIQSKRHQDGRENGYKDETAYRREKAKLEELEAELFERRQQLIKKLEEKYGSYDNYLKSETRGWRTGLYPNDEVMTPEEIAEYNATDLESNIYTKVRELKEKYLEGVPSAPFEKNWAELAFKRMLRYAAENGYDYVAWTTGDQQAKRYGMLKAVSKIVRRDKSPVEGKRFLLVGDTVVPHKITVSDEGIIVASTIENIEGKPLSEVMGKEVALKMMQMGNEASLESTNLRIGGEGMKAFYDQMLPSFVKKYTKKWGAEVGEVAMPALVENNTMHAVNVTDSMRESVMQGQPKFSLPTDLLTDFAEEFNSLQKEYESLDPSTIDYKHLFRVRKREVVQRYADHVTEVLGLPCEVLVIDADDIAQVQDAYDRYVQSHQAVLKKDPKRSSKVGSFDEFIATIKNDKGEYASGVYFNGTDFIVMVITDSDEYNKQNGYLQVCIHENVHGVMDTLKITEFEKKAVLAEGMQYQPEGVRKTLEGYENADDAVKGEELIAYAIDTRLKPRYGTLLLDYFEGRASKADIWKSYNLQLPLRLSLTSKILNYLKDGYERKQTAGEASGYTGGSIGANSQYSKRFGSGYFEENNWNEQRGGRSVDTHYSLSDIPFFDAEGNAIDMSAISEAKALEMIDGRVRDMMAYDYDKSVIEIVNQAKKDRRATRAYYAEERRKRRGSNEAPRTNAAKIDELFADTNINSLPLEVQALIFIAEGRAKIRWADKDGKRGLASELGLANSASDKAAMKSVWSGAEQSFDEVVHGWWESINGYERGIDTQDLRNALIEALMSFPSAKAAMRELQTQYDAIATAEREALEEIDRREAADLDRVKREYEERSARFEMSEGDERESMREMAVEHYSSQPLSAADEALEELTDKLNKMERRAERLLLDQKSGYRELAESIEKSKEVIIRTLEHLRMFSGMEQIHIDEVAKLINMTRTARSKRQVEAVATKAKNLIQRIAIRKARENMRRLLDLKLSNVEVIQQILKESNTLPREERDALLKSLWKVSRNGWRATKAVHPDTKEIFKELNDLIKEYKKSVKDKEVATIKQTITDRLVSLEAELHPDVEVDDKGNVIDNAGLPTDFNDSNRNIALHLFKSYLEVGAKNVAYSEANKTLRETDKGSEKFGEALSNMYVAREDYLSALKQFNATLEDVIVNGKDKLRDFNIEKEKHEVALRSMAIKAIGGKKASAQGKRGNALQRARAWYNRIANSPYWTFETVLERIDRLSPYKKGEFYNYFMRKYTDANAKLYTSYTAHMESIGSAMARCFPDMAKQFGIIGRNPYEIYKAVMRKAEATALGTIKYKEDGVEREMQLTVANAMYIVAMWRQPRYREAMEGNGITQEQINNLMQSINKEHAGYINFMDWVNTALLPNTRLEYDEVYRKLNGGSLAKEENYFPARVVTHEDVKLDENGKGQLPSSPSALKERISHKTMPKMGTDYFKVLEAHIQDMDKWAAFAELTADLNVILSSDEFRRRLNEFMPGIGGDGGGKGSLYKMLYDTALITTGNYHNSGENVFGPIQKAWATSNIAFRFWTAVKQISSVSVGITEHVYFAKHMAATATVAGIAYEWKRAMELSPSLRYRWQSKAAGMEALMRETSRGDGYARYRGGVIKTYDAFKDLADKAVKLGMTPNALVDAIACSILVNSVYDKAIHDMTKGKREATEAERKEAIRKAEIAFNSTQQSSEGAYLSAAQANPLYAPLTTYMNASYALHRKRMSGIHELWKLMTSKEYRRFLKDEYGVDAAKISAKDAFADIIRGIVGDLSFAAMGWGLMEVMSAVYEWLGGDGDDDDTEAEKQAFFETYWMPALNGLLGGGIATSIMQGFDTSMTPAYDELLEDFGGLFDDKGDWRVEVAQAATKYGLGIDLKSLYRIGAGLENMVAEEKDENAGSILMFLNAPNKYIKAFVGDRREGETLQQYQTRIMRLYTLFDKVMYEELYDENGKYIGEGAPSMIMSQTQAKDLNKEYEAAYLKDVVVRNGGWDEYRTLMSTEMLYKDICEFIGVTPDAQPSKAKLRNTVYSTGEYVAPVYGLSQKEHGELLSAESYVAGAHYYRTRWVGDDEGYYGLLKEEYRKKSELIDKYNEYIK